MNSTTQARTRADDDLIGAEVVFGAAPIGRVLDVIRDPLSQRVRRLITTYGRRPARGCADGVDYEAHPRGSSSA